MTSALRRLLFWLGYLYGALAVVVCATLGAALLLIPCSARWRQRTTTRVIAAISRAFIVTMHRAGVFQFDLRGLQALRPRRGVIFAANHPTFLDALLLFGVLPGVFCVTKASLLRHPLLIPILRAAGYLEVEQPRRLMRSCADRLRAGDNLLVFPEGTRSPQRGLHPFKPGFAHVALHAPAPVITLHVAGPPGDFLRKGTAFFRPWQPLPIRYVFRAGAEFPPREGDSTKTFLTRVEAAFHPAVAATP